MPNGFDNLWIRGGQPVATGWIAGEAKVDVSTLNWTSIASLLNGENQLSVETALASPSGRWVRISGLIVGAAAGSRGNIGWSVSGDADIEIPVGIASRWSDAWLSWRHGEIDANGLVTRLIPGTGSKMEGSVCVPQPSPPRSASRPPWKILLIILAAVAAGFTAGWFTAFLACPKQASPPSGQSTEGSEHRVHPTK